MLCKVIGNCVGFFYQINYKRDEQPFQNDFLIFPSLVKIYNIVLKYKYSFFDSIYVMLIE